MLGLPTTHAHDARREPVTQIGFVGLGRMGGNMVARIKRDSDHDVFAFDRDPDTVQRIAVASGAAGGDHDPHHPRGVELGDEVLERARAGGAAGDGDPLHCVGAVSYTHLTLPTNREV